MGFLFVQTTRPAEIFTDRSKAGRLPKRNHHFVHSFSVLLQNRLYRELFVQSWQRLFGTVVYVRLRLDVDALRLEGRGRMTLAVRPIEKRDYQALSSILSDRSMTRHERHEAARRLVMLEAEINTCYVIEDIQGNIRFLQWLILPAENEKLRRTYGDWYPTLAADEGLVESAYVFPRYRGTGILPCGVVRIVEVALAQGAQHILTIVPVWNVNSLKSFVRMGFCPYQVRCERRFFGFHRQRIINLSLNPREPVPDVHLPDEVSRILFGGGLHILP